MSNSIKHASIGMVTGIVIGATYNFLQQSIKINSNPNYKFDYGELITMTLLGGTLGSIVGLLPDILEPAINPNHRQIFHSLFVLGFSIYGIYKTHNSDLDKFLKGVSICCLSGYISHIIDDSGTPKGIPIV